MTSIQGTRQAAGATRSREQRRLAVTTAAAAAAAATVWTGTQLAGIDLAVRSGAEVRSVGLASVLTVSVLAALAGGLTHRFSTRWAWGAKAWTALAFAVLLLSLAGPLGATTSAGVLALAGMHLCVGAVVILGQPRTASRGVA
jgi:hypothetical protein